ncbi:hypothetical protein JTB14_028393 [Gonioctena quinquepunctata]|nr:hypothetical protein JTB14_028393 [Gonioctena quinquepunctata]
MITRGNKDAVIPFITSSLLTSTMISGAVALGQELIDESVSGDHEFIHEEYVGSKGLKKIEQSMKYIHRATDYANLYTDVYGTTGIQKIENLLMFLLLVTKKPSQIELTETVVLNHDLAVKILKGIYTLAAVVFNM